MVMMVLVVFVVGAGDLSDCSQCIDSECKISSILANAHVPSDEHAIKRSNSQAWAIQSSIGGRQE